MPKFWGKQTFTHGRFPEVGQKQKTEKKKEKDRKYVIIMASYALQRHLGWRTQSRMGQHLKLILLLMCFETFCQKGQNQSVCQISGRWLTWKWPKENDLTVLG